MRFQRRGRSAGHRIRRSAKRRDHGAHPSVLRTPRKDITMRANWRLRLAALAAAAIAALVLAPAASGGTSLADHGCQAGTSWDNILQACR
jgi:hypothetical protein